MQRNLRASRHPSFLFASLARFPFRSETPGLARAAWVTGMLCAVSACGGEPPSGPAGDDSVADNATDTRGISGTSTEALGAAATQSFEVTTQPFSVQPGAEVFGCQDFANPAGGDAAIVQTVSTMTQGIYQAYVFHDPTITRSTNSMVACNGFDFLPYVHLTQSPTETVHYPSGVGRYLPGTDGLRVRLHVVNSGSTALTVHFDATFQWTKTSQQRHLAAELHLSTTNLIIPPELITATNDSFTAPYALRLVQSESIMHRLGVHFHATSTTPGGVTTTLNDGTTWLNPTVDTFTTPIAIPKGSAIKWSCTYDNTTPFVVHYGSQMRGSEECVLAGIIYPSGSAHQGEGIDSP